MSRSSNLRPRIGVEADGGLVERVADLSAGHDRRMGATHGDRLSGPRHLQHGIDGDRLPHREADILLHVCGEPRQSHRHSIRARRKLEGDEAAVSAGRQRADEIGPGISDLDRGARAPRPRSASVTVPWMTPAVICVWLEAGTARTRIIPKISTICLDMGDSSDRGVAGRANRAVRASRHLYKHSEQDARRPSTAWIRRYGDGNRPPGRCGTDTGLPLGPWDDRDRDRSGSRMAQ